MIRDFSLPADFFESGQAPVEDGATALVGELKEIIRQKDEIIAQQKAVIDALLKAKGK